MKLQQEETQSLRTSTNALHNYAPSETSSEPVILVSLTEDA